MKVDVRDYGAMPDGGNCTQSIQKAIDDCYLKGGGEVVVPAGIYLAAGLRLRSNVTLHLMENAVLQGSIDLSALVPGSYLCVITCRLSPGREMIVQEFTFTIER